MCRWAIVNWYSRISCYTLNTIINMVLILYCFLFSMACCVFFLFLGQLSHTSCVLNHMEHVFVWTLMIEDICLSPYICLQGIFASFNDTANSMFFIMKLAIHSFTGDSMVFITKKPHGKGFSSVLLFFSSPLSSFLLYLIFTECQPCARQDLQYPKLQVSNTIKIVYSF